MNVGGDQQVYGMWAQLKLAYTPVSNQEAEWVRTDAEVEALLRTSDFYVIAIRDLVTFDEDAVVFNESTNTLNVPMKAGHRLLDSVDIDIYAIAGETLGHAPESVVASFGEGRIIRLTDGALEEADDQDRLYEWFSTEKMILDRGRGMTGLGGFNLHRAFATYELLYVGIAKKGDTFERLFETAHSARQSILTNEHPRLPGARVSDEMVLFPFRIEPSQFKTIASADDLTDTTEGAWAAYKKKVVVDAEKAFVKLLNPQYNKVKYKQYPVSSDGLWDHGYTGYGFTLAENVTFTTPAGTFVGSIDPSFSVLPDSHADMLMVQNDEVTLVKGVAMPSEHL